MMTSAIIYWNNKKQKKLTKFSQASREILEQFDESRKGYIKMFEAAGLVAHPKPR